MDFFKQWIEQSQKNQKDTENSPAVARGDQLEWVETPNDYQFAFLIAEQVGFPTQGTSLGKAIIPAGHHSGRQRHGEEALYILRGSGFAIVEGRRYDFREGTTLHVPYMSEHQFFNTGDGDVEYVTATTIDLDLFVRLGRLEQLEDKGANKPGFEDEFPAEDGQHDAQGRRIALHLEDAPDEEKRREELRKQGKKLHGHKHGEDKGEHRHGAIFILMGGGESPTDERNEFTGKATAMTNIFEEVPGTSSHRHSHTEAMLYVVEGEGYSEIDHVKYEWKAGDAVHVPPKMTCHEHFNPSDKRTRTLRIEFGIRYFYEDLWEGYHKVEHRLEAQAIPGL